MKHLLNITRALHAAAVAAHVQALRIVVARCDRTLTTADDTKASINEVFNDALDKASDVYAAAWEKANDRRIAASYAIDGAVRSARDTLHDSLVEANRLGVHL